MRVAFLYGFKQLTKKKKKIPKESGTLAATESSLRCHQGERQETWEQGAIRRTNMVLLSKETSELVSYGNKCYISWILKVYGRYFPAVIEP